MKHLLSLFTIALAFASCSKEHSDVIVPETPQAIVTKITPGDVAITNVKATVINGGQHVRITFNTLKEIDCEFISVNSGTTDTYLCSIQKWDIHGVNSNATKAYTFVDTAPKAKTMHYLIYYQGINEKNWATTDVLTVHLP
jgi:hypothetical protein